MATSKSASPSPPTGGAMQQKVVRLARRPTGRVLPGIDLVVSYEPVPSPRHLGPNQVLLHRLYLSLDPAMRGWMSDTKSYLPPVTLGSVMRGNTVNEVVASTSEKFRRGDLVTDYSDSVGGWQEYAVVSADDGGVRKLESYLPSASATQQLPISSHLSVLGVTGMTAYFGLLDVGNPKAGETVLVNAAAGAVGSIVCQIAKHICGCKVVGVAGGPEKCAWLLENGLCDTTVDYKAAKDAREFGKLLKHSLKTIDSKGFDVFFDNVGGDQLNEGLKRLNVHGRIILCGAISMYNDVSPAGKELTLRNSMALISLRAKMEGFIVLDYMKKWKDAKREMSQWIAEGKLTYKEDVRDGLENAPDALAALFDGTNTGKLIVRVGEREATLSKL